MNNTFYYQAHTKTLHTMQTLVDAIDCLEDAVFYLRQIRFLTQSVMEQTKTMPWGALY